MILLNVVMLVVPSFFAWMIHNYLCHGKRSVKRNIFFLILYFFMINSCVYMISWCRGIRALNFANMTLSYHMKYLGLGCVLGFMLPFGICLLFEEQISMDGIMRYAKRFIIDLKKYSAYAVRAAKSDLRSEVANSYLDWLWWLIEPICMMLIYVLIFGVVFKASEQYFPVFIFIGITMWSFFTRSISGSVNIVRSNRDIVTKVYIPKYILLLSRMLVNSFKMLVSFGIVFSLMCFFRVHWTRNVLFCIPILIVFFLFTFGVGTILMHYGVYVNDLGYITGIVLQMLMYLTGTFYSVSKRIPEPFGIFIEQCNPVAFLIAAMRNALLYGIAPKWTILLLWGLVSLILTVLGAFTIYSNENAYVKII